MVGFAWRVVDGSVAGVVVGRGVVDWGECFVGGKVENEKVLVEVAFAHLLLIFHSQT